MAGDLFYRVSVEAGGVSYDLSSELSSFTVEEDSGRPNMLSIEMSDPYRVFSHALQEGMNVEVDVGSVDDHSVIFRGRIYQVQGDFPQEGVATLKLQAYDGSMRMGLRRRNRLWTGGKLSDFVTEIAEEYFDRVTVDLRGDPSFSGNGIRQQDETDLAFLFRLAERYGCEMFAMADDNGESFQFVAQQVLMENEPEVTLYFGRCGVANRLVSFQANTDVNDIQLPRVFSGIEYESGERQEVTSAEAGEGASTEDPFLDENLTEFRDRFPERAAGLEGLLGAATDVQERLREELGGQERETTLCFTTQEDLSVRAENRFSTSIHGMRGSGTAVGNHRIRAQATAGIADVGGRFSGTWYLSQVRHKLDQQGYVTEFECRR